MKNQQVKIDLPQCVFSLLFMLLLIMASYWVVQPFLIGFTWACMVVIATWPMMIKIQCWLWGKRFLAVMAMTILLLLLFIIPITLLVNSVIDNSTLIISWATTHRLHPPQLDWLNDIPIVGGKIYASYRKLIAGGGAALMAKIQPYIGQTTSFFVAQAGHFGRLMIHLSVMLVFSVLLYWQGEQVSQAVRHFAFRMASTRGDAAVLLAGQAIRAVALGVVVTALVQGVLGGLGLSISGVPYSTLFTLIIFFACLVQLGPLVVLIPAAIWLYWQGDRTWGTVLLIWSGVVCMLDNVLRPVLIRLGADLPMVLIFCGVIGGLFAFGMIGLFIGPVVLAVSFRLLSAWIHEAPTPNKDAEAVVEALTEHLDKPGT